MNREKQHQQVIERYIAEGRTVSGGKQDNPPDRYIAVTLSGNIEADLAAINANADADYRIVGMIPGYVLMGNYKENK
jgi:hypothetical protein